MAHKNVGDFEIGDEVMISPENDNENYDSFRDKKLIIVDKVTSSDEHPAFDSALEGQGLYSFETEDGEEVPFSLYDYELVMPYSLYMKVNYDENYNIQKEEEKLRDLENITIQAENEVKRMSDSEVANYLGIPVSEINNLKRDDAVDKRVEELFNLWLEKDYENGGTTKNWDEYERGGKVVRYSDGRKRRLDTWNSGRSWTMDRKYYNKNEDWEIPMNERKTKGKQEVSFLTGEPIKEESKQEEKVETSFLSGQPTEVKEEKKEEKVETSFLSGEPEEEGEGITGLAERGGKIVRYSDGRKRRLDTWNRGRSWTMDRKYYNKNEDWEIPMDKRSSKSGETKTENKDEKSFLSGEPTEVKKDDTNWSWLGFEDGGETEYEAGGSISGYSYYAVTLHREDRDYDEQKTFELKVISNSKEGAEKKAKEIAQGKGAFSLSKNDSPQEIYKLTVKNVRKLGSISDITRSLSAHNVRSIKSFLEGSENENEVLTINLKANEPYGFCNYAIKVFAHKGNYRYVVYDTLKEIKLKSFNNFEDAIVFAQIKAGYVLRVTDIEWSAADYPKDYLEDGGEMGGYMVFNYTDNIYASPEVFRTKREANDFIREFRKRFERQGYYRDNKMNKVAIEDIDLLAIPSNFSPFKREEGGSMYESGGGVDGRSTRDKSTWNSGASWTRDRNSFNKSEDWEIPMNKRKHEEGGNIQSEISKEELENMVGRKLNGWNDDKVEYNGNTYQKCFLKPYYKLI